MISVATLPPKKGYVEVEVNGERCYKHVETGTIYRADEELPTEKTVYELANENKLLKEQITALTSRDEFLEDCLAEVATIVYN